MIIRSLKYVTPIENANQENDNIDVHVELDDGRVFSVLVATPNNIFWCMENEDIDYFFGTPAVYVKLLNRDCVERALNAVVTENNGRWLTLYGAIQV